SVILDATFGRRIHRDRVKELCGRLGVIHRFIEVHTSDTVVKQRLKERDSQANVVSDARLEDFDKLNRRYEAPSEVSCREVITANSARSPEATLLEVLKKLVQLQLETTP